MFAESYTPHTFHLLRAAAPRGGIWEEEEERAITYENINQTSERGE